MLFVDIFLWMITFAAVCVTFDNFITRNSPFQAFIYFLCIIGLIIVRYKNDFKKLIHKISNQQILVLILILVSHISTYYIINEIWGQPTHIFPEDSISFLEMNTYFLFAKPFEILLQQTFILALIFILRKHNMKLNTIIAILFILFGGMHLFLIMSINIALALYFTFFGLCASYIFTLFITQIKNGFIYSVALHMGFYQISGLLFSFLL
jgi:hypothetical protein